MNSLLASITILLVIGTVTSNYIIPQDNEIYDVAKTDENFFASAFYGALANLTLGNLIISPFSVHIAMSILAIGARGETLEELRPILEDLPYSYFNENKVNDITNLEHQNNIQLMNQLFIHDKFNIKTEYKESVKFFKAKITSLDFTNGNGASNKINSWCEKATDGVINNVVTARQVANAHLIIVSGAHYRGTWVNKFRRSKTYLAPFYVNSIVKKDVVTMHQRNAFNCGHLTEVSAKYIKLPYISTYKKQKMFMYIIVPDKKLEDIEQNLDKINFYELNTSKKRRKVDLSLPKFKLANTLDLNMPFKKLGINQIFTQKANFSGITEDHTLKVSKIIQQSRLIIDEHGNEADSGSAVINMATTAPASSLLNFNFNADRPFLVVITTEDFIVFIGRVVDPTL